MSQTHSEDVKELAGFGYRQVLDRTLGGFSSFAAGFSYISILTGVFQMFYLGYGAGGPAFFWTWPLVFLGQFAVALCFAELAALYPLSGGVYQWARRVGSGAIGWMAGWIYLSASIISLAAVALALQATLPQVVPEFQWIGSALDRSDCAKNAVVLGCILIGLTTVINAVGVKLMARINNVGVVVELVGVLALIALLAANVRRDPSILFDAQNRGDGQAWGYLGPFLTAALMASYVMYGFDTAGTLAEETAEPRRRAPRAILGALAAAGLAGGLLLFFAILAVPDPSRPELGSISGGLPFLVTSVLGPRLGAFLLCGVVFAIIVCAIAVHAAAVRLMFAMARDNNLPFAHSLAHVQPRSKAPLVPSLVIGVLAAAILFMNINLPKVIETLCSVAVVWANLAYLCVTAPLLVGRFVGGNRGVEDFVSDSGCNEATKRDDDHPSHSGFSMGAWGLPVNALAVVWGLFIVINIGWPRAEIHGSDGWSRLAAPLATTGLIVTGVLYYVLVQRTRTTILPEHSACETVTCEPHPADVASPEPRAMTPTIYAR